MVNERDYDKVSDDLTGLQARLRGEEPPEIATRRVQMLPTRPAPQTSPDAIPTLRIGSGDETLSVSHDGLTVFEDAPRSDRDPRGDADVIPMPGRSGERVSEIAERLARLERELTDVLHGLEDAEELLGPLPTPLPTPLPVEESTGDPLLDLQRLVARRLEADPGN
jgi:hypothetical protein